MSDQPFDFSLPYFAYGSNLNLRDLDRWCRERNDKGGILSFWQTARLPNHAVRFSLYSNARKGGVLDIHSSLGEEVPGVLFHVAGPRGWALLDKKEGAPNWYERVATTVALADGSQVAAITYRVCVERLSGFIEPANNYLQVVCQGLRRWELAEDHVVAAARGHQRPSA